MPVDSLIEKLAPQVADLRHRLHQIPELGYEEVKTAAAIRAELDRLGIAYVAAVDNAPTATSAWDGDGAKPSLALRAAIDALPITGQAAAAAPSKHPGCTH